MSAIEERVIDTIRERAEGGYQKYGVTMERSDLSLVQWLDHLQQELLDGSIYLEKIKEVLTFSNILDSIITNEHGLVCPIPLSLWPTWANYAAVDDFGYLAFFESEPKFDEEWYGWRELTNVNQVYLKEVQFEDREKAFWKRK